MLFYFASKALFILDIEGTDFPFSLCNLQSLFYQMQSDFVTFHKFCEENIFDLIYSYGLQIKKISCFMKKIITTREDQLFLEKIIYVWVIVRDFFQF